MTTVKDIVAAMDDIAPPALAIDGDPVGLHAGDPARRVRRVLVALDASYAAMDAAAKIRAGMLVVHHPRFYRGLSTLAVTDAAGRRAATLARQGLAVFSAHTNWDVAPGGVNDQLALAAGLTDASVVVPTREERIFKLAVFVPASHAEKVRKAVCAAGAGAIGRYAECTFRARGVGTFSCGAGTAPFQGSPGSFEEADEYRVETVFHEFARDRVIAAMLAAHPYEEVAYDVHPLDMRGKRYGLGRVGNLVNDESLDAFARRLAAATGSTMAQVAGKGSRRLRRVALWAGAGADVRALASCGADAVAAGEIGYHDLETLLDAGMGVVTLGHGFSEELSLKPLGAKLRKRLPGLEVSVAPRGAIAMRNIERKSGR